MGNLYLHVSLGIRSRLLFAAVFLFSLSAVTAQTTISAGTSVNASAITAGNTITIENNATLVMNVARSFASITTSNVGSGVSTVSGPNTLTLTGALTIVPGTSLTFATNLTGTTVVYTSTLATTSTLTVNTGSNLMLSSTITVNSANGNSVNAVLAGGGTVTSTALNLGTNVTPASTQTTALTYTLSSLTLSGALTVRTDNSGANNNNATFNHQSGSISATGALALNFSAGTTSVGTYTMASGAQTGTLLLGAAAPVSTAGTGTSSITFNGTGSTVSYNRGGAQTVYGVNYNNLTLATSGVKTLQVATTQINGNLTLSGTAQATAVVALDINGSVSLGAGTTFSESTFTHTVAGDWTNNGGAFTVSTGTITFDGSGPQAINGTAAAQTFNNITLSKSAGTLLSVGGSTISLTVANLTETSGNFSAPATLTASGNLTVTTGTYTASTNTSIAGNFSNSATFNAGGGTVTFTKAAGTQTLNSGGSSFFNVSHTGAGILQLNSNPLSTTGTFSNSTGTFDANGLGHTVTGLATVSGGTYQATTTQTFNGGLTISGGTVTMASGTLNTTDLSLSTGTLTAPPAMNVSGNWSKTGGTFTPGALVTFNGAGTQTLNSGGTSFVGISHSGSGTLQLTSNALAGTAAFTNSGGPFDANSQSVTITGLTTISAGNYLASTATQTFNGGLTVSGSGVFVGSTGDVSVTDVTLTLGSFTAPSGSFMVSGNWSRTGATFTPGTNTVTFTKAAVGTQTLNSGGASFYNISHTGTGTLQLSTNALTVTGAFTNSAGIFDANGLGNTVAGLTTVSGGTYTASTATQSLNGGLTISGSGVVNGSTGTIAIAGNLSIANGSTMSGTGTTLTVTGVSTIGGGVNGSLTLASSSTAIFQGPVIISAGATWDSGNSSVTFQGGLSRGATGSFNAGATGSYIFDTNSQSLTGTFSIPNITVTGVSLTNNNNVTVSTLLTGSGSFTQAAGSTLTLGGTTSITTLNASNSGNTVTYNGPSQTIDAGTYDNLTITQTSGDASLAGAVTVNGALTLNGGNINLGANDLTVGSSGSISGATSAKRIIISGAGKLSKVLSSLNTLFTFPIGDVLYYTPVDITVNGTGTPYTLSASVTDAKHPSNSSTTNYLTRYWSITQTGVTGATANITGTFDAPSDIPGGGSAAATKSAQLTGTFNQTTNPWVKYNVALNPSTLTVTGAPLTSGLPSVFTGITGADPTVNVTGGGVTICSGGSTPLTANPTGGDGALFYAWTPTTGLSASNVANPSASPTSTTSYTVTITDANGIAASSSAASVTVNQPPSVAAAGSDQNQCNSGSFTLAGNTPTIGTGTWTIFGAANGAVITGGEQNLPAAHVTGLTAGSSTTLRWTVSNAGCTSTVDDVVLTNDAAPTTAAAGTDINQCSSGSFTLAGNTPATGTGTWTVFGAANGAVITAGEQNLPGAHVTGLTAGSSTTLRWTVTNGTCGSFDDVVLTNDATATTAAAGTDISQCNTGSFTLNGNT
ncbi:MAG TPA: hypothetical protein VL728_03500, partial [Cyclobacteriaceae bacterium]|nr:hypothetical protein [Cyclobacteriaceae bacterium]